MNPYPELAYRQAFYRALIDPSADACPDDFHHAPTGRFRIYRNNVLSSLIGALADAYPVVKRLVGDDFFTAMARQFILAETHRPRSLALYGEAFATFIENFSPAQAVAYLADIARLERARLVSMNASDATPLNAADLPVDGNLLLAAKLQAHPALQLVSSNHPIYSIWLANQVDQAESLVAATSEYVLVTRPQYSVQMHLLDPAAMTFTTSLIDGSSIQDAFNRASSLSATLDIQAVFSLLLQAGAFLSLQYPEED